MILRRALGAGLAAVLAAGPLLVLPAAPAQAATEPGYIAVVISGHGTHCVRWKSGISGDTVLNDAATVAYRNDGLIVQIDGDPSSGTADASHFWSYWHDTKGTWSYSNYGASSYHPPAGSVEGWSYDNGKASAPKPSQNPSGLYAKLCGAKDKKKSSGGTVPVPTTSTTSTASTASTASTPTRTRTTASPRSRTHAAAPRSSAPAQTTPPAHPSSTSSTSLSASPSRTAASATRTSAPANGVTATSPSSRRSAGASPRSAPGTIDASPTASSSSSGSPVGLLVGIGLVVVLGAAAGAVALRRRSAGS